jgi:hypothetical protein
MACNVANSIEIYLTQLHAEARREMERKINLLRMRIGIILAQLLFLEDLHKIINFS